MAEWSREQSIREAQVGHFTPAAQAVVNCGPKVSEDIFGCNAVNFHGVCGALAEFDSGKGDVQVTGNHGPNEFSCGLAAGESEAVGKFCAFRVGCWGSGLFEFPEIGGVTRHGDGM